MEEWKTCKIGDVCRSISDTYRGNAEEVVLINTSDVSDGKCLNHLKIPNHDLKGQFKKTFQKDDILYSEIRPANKRFAYIDFDAVDYIASTKLMVIRSNNNILPGYLFYILTNNSILEELQVIAESRSGTFPQITFSEVANMDIYLPPITKQEEILSILKSLDDKIENNRKINENLEQQAQALFKSWFVDFEPFRDQPFVESELGMIPEGWRVEELGKLIETTSGGTPSRKIDNYYNNGSIYWVKSKELLDNFIINTEEKITDVAIKESSAKLLPSHSVLIAMYGATVGAIGITTKSMACNQAICALLPNQLLPYTFLYLFAKFSKIYLQNKAVGSAQQNISQIIIKSLKVSYNSNAIKRFNSIVEPLLTIIEKNAFESHCLSHLRDTLLPKLMSGEITL